MTAVHTGPRWWREQQQQERADRAAAQYRRDMGIRVAEQIARDCAKVEKFKVKASTAVDEDEILSCRDKKASAATRARFEGRERAFFADRPITELAARCLLNDYERCKWLKPHKSLDK